MKGEASVPISAWVVNRSPNSAEMVGSLLRNAGLRVRTRHVPDLSALNQALATDRPDLLLCPETNGPVAMPDVIARAQACAPPIPVIVGGERPDSTRMAAAIRQGAACLMDFQAGELLAAVVQREIALTGIAVSRLSASEQLRQWQRQYEQFVAHTSDPIATITEGVLTQVNTAFSGLLGYDQPSDIEGTPVMDIIAPASRNTFKRCLRDAQAGMLPDQALSVTGQHREGRIVSMSWHVGWAPSGAPGALQILIPAPSTDSASEQALAPRAESDLPVPERAQLEQDLMRLKAQLADAETRNAQLQAEHPASLPSRIAQIKTALGALAEFPEPAAGNRFLLTIHLDELPDLLPDAGYAGCETALQNYALALQALLPTGSVLVQLRDFWLTGAFTATTLDDAQKQASQWQAQLAQHVVEIGMQSRVLRAFFGVREWPDHASVSLEAAVMETERSTLDARSARQILGVVKRRNSGTDTAQADSAWANRLRAALAHERLHLVYQPISSLTASATEYYEVRLRLLDEAGQEQTPALFWPAAERTGVAEELDHWVFSHALAVLTDQRRTSNQAGFFVKLSAASILSERSLDWFMTHLPKGDAAAPMYLQIAEGNIESHLKTVLSLAQRLRQEGYGLAIDHFGSSPHALQLASHLSPKFIKLAPILLQEIAENQEAQNHIRQIVEYAERHGISVIAGHVESAHTLAMLWQLGVHYLQGHYVQEPEVVLHSPDQRTRPPRRQGERA